MNHLFFLIGLGLLLVHEMDAVRAREWRLFVGLDRLDDERGFLVFTALHIPLYVLLFLALFSGDGLRPNDRLVTVLSTFFVVHTLLHVSFARHPKYDFHSTFSWLVIVGTGVCGALDLGTRALRG